MTHDEHHIRERAYHLWEKAGRPTGRDAEFWRQARDEADRAAHPPVEVSAARHNAVEAPADADPTPQPVAETKATAARKTAAKAPAAAKSADTPAKPKTVAGERRKATRGKEAATSGSNATTSG